MDASRVTMEEETKTIVFLGKLGHGKTRLINLLCGTNFSSSMAAGSCTTRLQRGTTERYGIQIVDTPGFESSDNTASHTDYQIAALESCQLSGVYIVVKYGRLGDMASTAGMIMDFADTEDARIIVTFVDSNIAAEEQIDIHDAKTQLSMMMDVSIEHIAMVGKHTHKEELEAFVQSTLLPAKRYHVSADFKAYANTLQVGARKGIVIMNALSDGLKSGDETTIQLNQNLLRELEESLSAEERCLLVARLHETLSPQLSDMQIRSMLKQSNRPITCPPKRKIPEEECAAEYFSKKHKTPQFDEIPPAAVDGIVAPPLTPHIDFDSESTKPSPHASFEQEQTTGVEHGLHHRHANGVTVSSSYQDLDAMERGEVLETRFQKLSLGEATIATSRKTCQRKPPMASCHSKEIRVALCIASCIIIGFAVALYSQNNQSQE